ncbi:MAG: hypothetical protein JKY37_19015 [Nannocystaceae bacterium]|nr:hypothetical protein [Nannocystaceae bacterium]
MVFIWRGLGLGVLLALAAVGFSLAYFVYDDPTLGNLGWIGWTCVITAGVSVLVALATLGGKEKGGWAKHSVFFVPVVFWPLILGAVGAWALTSYDPPSNHLRGEWVAKRCYGNCPAGTMALLDGFTLKIDETSVSAAGGESRTFEIEKDEDAIVLLRFADDDSTELMRVLSHDEIVGQFDEPDGGKYSIAFARTAEAESPTP